MNTMNTIDPAGSPDPSATRAAALLAIAARAFAGLSEGEMRTLDAAALGTLRMLGAGTDESRSAARADRWGPEQSVRAELLQWLCTTPDAVAQVDRRGIWIMHARIVGQIDLSFARVPFPLRLQECSIPQGMRLEHTHVAKLSLAGSHTGKLWAVRMVSDGNVQLSDGFSTSDCVYLNGARIAGDLDCTGGHCDGKGHALLLAHAHIGGSVQLEQKFRAAGLVSLRSATIKGDLVCTGGTFTASETAEAEPDPSGADAEPDPAPPAAADMRAMNATQVEIAGSVLLGPGTRVYGSLTLATARIGRDLDLNGAYLSDPGKVTLAADRLEVGGDFFFHRGAWTDGVLRLVGANLKGDAGFVGAKFEGTGVNGVQLTNATVGRALFWTGVERSDTTELSLVDATAGSFHDDERSSPVRGKLHLAGFTCKRMTGAPSSGARRAWLELMPDDYLTFQPYEHLAALFRAGGEEAEARRVGIAREDRRYRLMTRDVPRGPREPAWRYGWWRFRRWVLRQRGRLLRNTLGYGYAPFRAVFWSALVVALGTLLFALGTQSRSMVPIANGVYRDTAYVNRGRLPSGYQTLDPLVYSLDSFLPIVNLHQEDHWLPHPTRRCEVGRRAIPCGRMLRIYLWLHIGIGWALTTLAVVGFTGIIRKV